MTPATAYRLAGLCAVFGGLLRLLSPFLGLDGQNQQIVWLVTDVFLLLGLILSGWAINQAPASAQTALINDWRVIPAQFAHIPDLRRVADMPGAIILES